MITRIDALITYLCEYIEQVSKENWADTSDRVAENVNALAKLIDTRAKLQTKKEIVPPTEKQKNTIFVDGQEVPTWQFVWEQIRNERIKIERNRALIIVNTVSVIVTLIIAIIGLL